MKFGIAIRHDGRYFRLRVEQLYMSYRLEKYRVIAHNGSFTVQTNRPLLLGKGLKHKPPDWKVVEGGFDKKYILEKITNAIEAKLKTL